MFGHLNKLILVVLMAQCEGEVEDLLRAVKDALEGYEARGYFTGEEIRKVADALQSWRICMRLRT